MDLAEQIKTDPLVFDKLLQPLQVRLEKWNQHPLSKAAGKLYFDVFIRLLLFRIFAQIPSLRDLVTDLHTDPRLSHFGFPRLGLSTIHDAFIRYPVAWTADLLQHLICGYRLIGVSELQALGQLQVIDSSHWPIPQRLAWLRRGNFTGVRLHLAFSLNQVCAATFLLTYDHSPSATERAALLAMLEAGVTYIMDRGYISLALCREMMEQRVFFVARERNNALTVVLCELPIIEHALLARLTMVTDQVIRLTRDKDKTILRLVCFTVGGHQFRLLTNRFDLHTHQIILLYAWRWQVELLFRAWKHTLDGLHLINLSPAGIAVQFHLLLLASFLWAILQQQTEASAPAEIIPAETGKKTGMPEEPFREADGIAAPVINETTAERGSAEEAVGKEDAPGVATVTAAPLSEAAEKTDVATAAGRDSGKKAIKYVKTMTGQVSQVFQVSWRLLRQPLRCLKNNLFQPLSVYLNARQAIKT